MLENVYEGLNARPKVYLSKEYFCEMYPTCVSSKLCEFILYIQGDPKKMSHSVFELKSVLDVGLDFSACVLESKF